MAMSTRFIVLIALAISYVTSKPATTATRQTSQPDIGDVSSHIGQSSAILFSESIPNEVRKFYGSLNAEEKGALREYAKELKEGQTNFSLADNVIGGIKSGSEELTTKLGLFRDLINSKLEGLSPDGKAFVEQMIRKLIIMVGESNGIMDILMGMKNFGRDVLKMFDSLSEKTRDELLQGFPTIGAIATSDIARVILNKLADYSPASGADVTMSPSRDIDDKPVKKVSHTPTTPPSDTPIHSSIYPSVQPNKDPQDMAGEDEVVMLKVDTESGQAMRVAFQLLIISLSICVVTPAKPIRSDLTSLAIELLEFVPSSFLTFFGDMNDTDRSALLELSKNISNHRLTADNEKHFLDELKIKSENAYTKVMGVRNYVQYKVENLKPDAKEFTKKLGEKYLSLFVQLQGAQKGTFGKLKIFVNETFKMFDELSAEGKADLRSAFTEITQLLENPRFRNYLRRVFECNEVKRAFNRADRAYNPKRIS
ncbi:unnamed protein product [Anisakis simplex]|uniref:Fatty-acid and retinol-binding protein 1 n=1 Tax=Anisakis simplex TaxID=6269 RepID=A0A0M3JZF1_ANISI|nr:unnamed protein product [Anisakis simplex]